MTASEKDATLNEKRLEVIRLILDIARDRPEELEKVFAEFDAIMHKEPDTGATKEN